MLKTAEDMSEETKWALLASKAQPIQKNSVSHNETMFPQIQLL